MAPVGTGTAASERRAGCVHAAGAGPSRRATLAERRPASTAPRPPARAQAAVGAPQASQISFVKALDASSRAAAACTATSSSIANGIIVQPVAMITAYGSLDLAINALKAGVDVVVLEVDEDKRRISLGLKQAQGNPWEEFADKHPVGTKVTGATVDGGKVTLTLEPAQGAWGEFFAEAAGGGLRDDLSRDLDRDRQVAEQAERVRQQELVKEREAHAVRDDELDHGL